MAQVPSTGAAPESIEQRERSALAACDAANWRMGIQILSSLWAETLEPVYVYNQGRCYQKNAMSQEALGRFKEFLRVVRDANDELATRARAYVTELEGELAAARADKADSKSGETGEVKLPPANVATGSVLSAPIKPRGDDSLVIAASPAAPDKSDDSRFYKSWWFWTVAGGLVAAGGLGAFLLVRPDGDGGVDCSYCSLPTTRIPTE